MNQSPNTPSNIPTANRGSSATQRVVFDAIEELLDADGVCGATNRQLAAQAWPTEAFDNKVSCRLRSALRGLDAGGHIEITVFWGTQPTGRSITLFSRPGADFGPFSA
ncbi:MAG: hypothetical protein GY898_29590 [Proteobacteria bacterium]|nr:hypothetical protein [Pseudomonadota bacterium]